MATRISVEKEFTECIKRVGGVSLEETLSRPRDFLNADYWFPNDNVVAELKCLSDNYWSDTKYKESLSELYKKWVRQKLVPPLSAGRNVINLQDLPMECIHEVVNPLRNKLDSGTLRGANRQIKGTKKHLAAEGAKGLLLLVSDGNFALPPSMVRHLLARSLTVKHSSINCVVHFSINETVHVPGIQPPLRFWFEWGIADWGVPFGDFLERLRSAWFAHISALTGLDRYEFTPIDQSGIVNQMKFSSDESPSEPHD